LKKDQLSHQQIISIVLPCYNPIEGWCRSLVKSIAELNTKLPDCTVQYIISNDGSTRLEKKGVSALTAIPNVVFLDNPVNEGKGSAIRKGTLRADGEIIIYTDIDFPFGTMPVVEIVHMFNENPDCWFVYGNRDGAYFKKLPVKRQLISKLLHLMNRMFLSKHITDTQAGIKGFRREILPEVQQTKTNTFVFEIELIRKLIKKKINIGSVNVSADPTIIFSDFSARVLFREAVNLAKIFAMTSIWKDIL
jgi:glycosyltransferase involved in cell wall biosynthesis